MKRNRRTYIEVTRYARELIDELNIFIKGNVNFQYNLKKKKNHRSAYVSWFVFLELVSFNTKKMIRIAPDKLDFGIYFHQVDLIVKYDIVLYGFKDKRHIFLSRKVDLEISRDYYFFFRFTDIATL